MPNLEGIGLQNFRTFKKKEIIKFAPITLITGTNNSGKSSIFKAIQLLVQNFKDGVKSEELNFSEMKHELGGLKRIINQEQLSDQTTKKTDNRYSQIREISKRFGKENSTDGKVQKPILNSDDDLVFSFPIIIGGERKIEAELELRYEVSKYSKSISHSIRSFSILKNNEYIHWSNISSYREYPDEGPLWEMTTSIDLKRILELILNNKTLEVEIENFEPNEGTQKYFEINFFERIEEFGVHFDFPFFQKNKEDYFKEIIKTLKEGKSIFSDYQKLSSEERLKYKELEQTVFDELILGTDNRQYTLAESFKRDFIFNFGKIERKINAAETGSEKINMFNFGSFSPNLKFYNKVFSAIEQDFIKSTKSCFNRLQYINFLPSLRGKNREWFLDEQDGESIQLLKEFSSSYLEHYQSVKSFLDFWIGKGETIIDGENVSKGFNIGKEVIVTRNEEIGLTKIFIKNFDETLTPIVDLGYGISQLIPIILKIATVAMKQEDNHEYDFDNQMGYNRRQTYYYFPSTLLIEEPEANLYPALQSKLAELFLDAASRFNIQFILETHSEYLIYKLQTYVGRKIISPEDIAIYYLNHPATVKEQEEKKYVNRVEIQEDGAIDYERYFGKGFFDEQTNLKLSLLNIQRDRFFENFETLKKEKLSDEERIEKQQHLLDKYTSKLNFTTYEQRVRNRFSASDKFQDKTFKYLASAYHLMEISDDNLSVTDYSPAIIQFGRAVESEVLELFHRVKDYLYTNVSDCENWIGNFNSQDIVLTSEIDNKKKRIFKGYIKKDPLNSNGGKYRINFGGANFVMKLLFNENEINLNQVDLLKEFLFYLQNNYFVDWNMVKVNIPLLESIIDERNDSAHTYASPINGNSAEMYKDKVERFLFAWSSNKK